MLAECGLRRLIEGGAGVGSGRLTLYKGWDGGLRVPVMIGGWVALIWTLLLWYILTVRSVKMAVQLWSQIWPTDKREPEARLGKP